MQYVRIGNYIYSTCESYYYPYWSIVAKAGEVKNGIDGEYIIYYP